MVLKNKTGYSNQKYDELILKAKTDTKDLQARWDNLLEVEKMLIKEDAVITQSSKRFSVCSKRYYPN